MLRDSRNDWSVKAMVSITIAVGVIVFAFMSYAIYSCNKLTPEQRRVQGYKEWTYVER